MPARIAAAVFFAAFASAAAVLLAAQATPDLFRVSRPLASSGGWARLVLPDDVLDACRPGLPDLRIFDASDREVPFALEERLRGTPARYAFRDVEKTPERETVAIIDRGRRPPLARSATLTIDGVDWLKPVTVESSDDRASWSVFAKASVFATRSSRSTTIRFPGNDRRWWRFRFDDRNGDPITPREARVSSVSSVDAAENTQDLRELVLPLSPADGSAAGPTATLPSVNSGVTALRIESDAPAYSRLVRVWERVFFRGEVLRRPIGEGLVVRAPDGSGHDEIAVCEPTGRSLELEVERMDGPPFSITRVVAIARPRAILFAAPSGEPAALRLAYGSSLVDAPSYDVERALSVSRPKQISAATLGSVAGSPAAAERAAGAGVPGVPDVHSAERGAPIDPARWKWKQPIALPPSGTVAYLDLAGVPDRAVGTPRILDAANRQVPYVLERAAHRERRAVQVRVSQRETKTVIEIAGLTEPLDVDAIELSATAPSYFSRHAVVLEQEVDARGAAGTRTLGAAGWEKRAEDEAAPLTISIARPASAAIRVEIENGDNAALAIGPVAIWTSVPRIDFVYLPDDRLTLVSGAADVPPPRYDLELVASRVLSAPALPAKLASRPAPVTPRAETKTPRWLWIPVAAAAVLVALVLARTLRAPGGGASSGGASSPPPSSPAP
jgi:hypothetical protein